MHTSSMILLLHLQLQVCSILCPPFIILIHICYLGYMAGALAVICILIGVLNFIEFR